MKDSPVPTGEDISKHLRRTLTVSLLKGKATGTKAASKKKSKKAKATRKTAKKKVHDVFDPFGPGHRVFSTSTSTRKDIFGRFKNELDLLICTDDKKYTALRKRLTSARTGNTIVGVLSAYFANTFGIAVGVATPIISSVLLIFLQLGRNAYCNIR